MLNVKYIRASDILAIIFGMEIKFKYVKKQIFCAVCLEKVKRRLAEKKSTDVRKSRQVELRKSCVDWLD